MRTTEDADVILNHLEVVVQCLDDGLTGDACWKRCDGREDGPFRHGVQGGGLEGWRASSAADGGGEVEHFKKTDGNGRYMVVAASQMNRFIRG